MDTSRAGLQAEQKYSFWFVIVSAVFITCLITANITAVKLAQLYGFIFPAAVLIFPLSYIIGDVLTEVYGYSRARQTIWLGFLCNLIVVAAVWLAQILPAAPFWKYQKAFEEILGYTPRLLAASFIAYLVGEFSNSFVLAKMKIATRGRWLWFRTIGSTIIGEGLDSLIFITLAFIGTIPLGGLLAAIATQWAIKCSYEIVMTPVTYIIVNFLKSKEQMDVYDYDTKFNPLPI